MDTVHMEAQKTSPRDVFLHLASIVALYGSAISFITISFQVINIWFPDVINHYYGSSDGYRNIARGAIAALFVFFPIYIASLRMLAKTYKENTEKKKLSIRKWLLYFTLFIASFVIAGDIISLINNFLDGDLTIKFLLKTVSVFLVSVVIFWYYRREVKDVNDGKNYYFGIVCSVLVVGALVCGIIASGSPFKERARKLDARRINDLQMTQGYIVEYWQNKGKLPVDLGALKDPLRGVSIPSDPETKKQYEYEVRGTEMFTLCAEFSSETESDVNDELYLGFSGNTSWTHKIGKTCFERTIDKDFYKKNSNVLKEAIPVVK